VLPDLLVGIVGAPVCLHLMLDLLYIEIGGDFLHKTPRSLSGRKSTVREEMFAPQHKVVFLSLVAGAHDAAGPESVNSGQP
jgi:hypothetical protein